MTSPTASPGTPVLAGARIMASDGRKAASWVSMTLAPGTSVRGGPLASSSGFTCEKKKLTTLADGFAWVTGLPSTAGAVSHLGFGVWGPRKLEVLRGGLRESLATCRLFL